MSNNTRPTGLILCLSVLIAGLASAPTAVSAQGTDEQTQACSGDAFTLCRAAIPDVAKITACMEARKAELSPKCRAFFHRATVPKAIRRKATARQVTPTLATKPHMAKPNGTKLKVAEPKTVKSKLTASKAAPKVSKPKVGLSRPIARVGAKAPVVAKTKARLLAKPLPHGRPAAPIRHRQPPPKT